MYSAGEVLTQDSFQVLDVGLSVEYRLELVQKPGGVQVDGAENFEGIALAGGGDFRLRPYPGPGLVQGGVLAEGGLVPKEEGRPFAIGFFLTSGNRERTQRDWRVLSARARVFLGR